MITPDFLNDIIIATEEVVSRLNEQLVEQISEAIAYAFYKGFDDIIIPATIADLHKVMQSGYTLDEIQLLIEKNLPYIEKEIRKAFLESAQEIAKYNDDFTKLLIDTEEINVDYPEFTHEGIPESAADLNMTKNEIITLEEAYKRTQGTLKNITQTTADEAYSDYVQGCDDAWMKIQAGMAPDKAIAESVDDLAKKGISAVSYPSGREDSVDVAVARAARTGINQANSEIILKRCAELGVGYVKVSQHLGARYTKKNDWTNHMWWQGKTYSLDWDSPVLNQILLEANVTEEQFQYLNEVREKLKDMDMKKYPDFVETCGYGKVDGIIGINCRHTFQMWFPDVNIDNEPPLDDEESKKRYDAEQKQRAMERAMRKTRRRIKALQAIKPQTDEAKAKIKELKQLLKEQGEAYKAFCDENNLPYYYERTR